MTSQLKIFRSSVLLIFLVLLSWGLSFADYVVTLKNGRKITVQSYRMDGSSARLNTGEGEIVLPKDEIIEVKEVKDAPVRAPQKKEETPLPEPKKSEPRKSPLYVP